MCVLRVSGPAFDPEAFLEETTLKPLHVFLRGEPWVPSEPEGPRHQESGFHVHVSDADWDGLRHQAADAERFLEANRAELTRLAQFPGVASLCLDFPLHLKVGGGVLAQSDYFPARLAALAGSLGIDLEFSLYEQGEA
jgi:hypothetical protein